MSLSCNCAESMLAFLAGSDIAQDVLSNKPPVLMQRQVPEDVFKLGREKMLDQFLAWMMVGAMEMKNACHIDTDNVVRQLSLAREQLKDMSDEKLKALIIQESNEVQQSLTDCALIELATSRHEPMLAQEEALKQLGAYRLVKRTEDGIALVETEKGRYIVDQEGLVFKEVSLGG